MKGKSDSQKIPTDILFQKPKGSLETGKGIYWAYTGVFLRNFKFIMLKVSLVILPIITIHSLLS